MPRERSVAPLTGVDWWVGELAVVASPSRFLDRMAEVISADRHRPIGNSVREQATLEDT